jgi:hypothetical protein
MIDFRGRQQPRRKSKATVGKERKGKKEMMAVN